MSHKQSCVKVSVITNRFCHKETSCITKMKRNTKQIVPKADCYIVTGNKIFCITKNEFINIEKYQKKHVILWKRRCHMTRLHHKQDVLSNCAINCNSQGVGGMVYYENQDITSIQLCCKKVIANKFCPQVYVMTNRLRFKFTINYKECREQEMNTNNKLYNIQKHKQKKC